jgi:hypothetical protein
MTRAFAPGAGDGNRNPLSAWEADCPASLTTAPQVRRHLKLSAGTRQVPLLTPPSGTQRARFHVGGRLFEKRKALGKLGEVLG